MAVSIGKAIILYFVIMISLRIMGKRQIGELQPTELVVTILISNIASLPIEDVNIPVLGAILPIATIVCLEVFVSYLSLRFRRVRELLEGDYRVIIQNGVIDQKELANLRFSLEDILEELRAQGIFDIRDVVFAAVETNGKISVYQKKSEQPVTASQMGIETGPDSLFTLVVSDGTVLEKGMRLAGVDQKWLKKTLEQENCSSVKEVFLLTVNQLEEYYLVKRGTQE
ncbi:MAG: DUF421 domain-containing protein [Oscillospiraceae bacterium]|jgi:uncharacterized membrane protein YcaP (DUF421 family)|nr:DUF421 domain-containing protein [Oscillospiraceae bacterium]